MLRELQKNRVKKLLTSQKEPWKVLILDKRTQEILSPLIKMKELRDCGITSHFLISQKRFKIANTPALYFVSDLEGIYEDVVNSLYLSYHIHCVTTIKRKSLEKLGYSLSSKGLGLQVSCVYDQFLNFISLQDDFFSFEIQNSYLYKENTDIWRDVVSSLMSIFVTLDSVPFIISTDDTCKNIARMLEDKIKGTNIIKKKNTRPVLILLNRDYDIITPIQHVWSYSALMDDLLGIHSNKVTVKDKTYDLDPTDSLWKKNRNEYFPIVVEKVERELVEYKKEMALRSIDSKSDKKKIQETLEAAPELAKRNDSVNAHISICLEMVEIIKNRNIDDFYKVEKSGYTNDELMDISEKGDSDDILRLALNIINTKDSDIAEAILEKRKIKTSILNYFKKFTNTSQVEKGTFSNVVSNLMGNVKKFLPIKERSPISELVEDIYSSIKGQNHSKYENIDPLDVGNVFLNEVSSIVVCCIGGATYSELKTLKILEEKIKIPIIYGGTEILNAKKFIKQIEELVK